MIKCTCIILIWIYCIELLIFQIYLHVLWAHHWWIIFSWNSGMSHFSRQTFLLMGLWLSLFIKLWDILIIFTHLYIALHFAFKSCCGWLLTVITESVIFLLTLINHIVLIIKVGPVNSIIYTIQILSISPIVFNKLIWTLVLLLLNDLIVSNRLDILLCNHGYFILLFSLMSLVLLNIIW